MVNNPTTSTFPYVNMGSAAVYNFHPYHHNLEKDRDVNMIVIAGSIEQALEFFIQICEDTIKDHTRRLEKYGVVDISYGHDKYSKSVIESKRRWLEYLRSEGSKAIERVAHNRPFKVSWASNDVI